MQYKKEIIFLVIAVLVVIAIGNYIVQNQSMFEKKGATEQQSTVPSGEPEKQQEEQKTVHDTYTGVFMVGEGLKNNRILKIDNSGTVALETFKEGVKTVEYGSWVLNPQKELIVSILGNTTKGQYKNPATIIFSYNDKNLLVANTYDSSVYKEGDLTFRKLKESEISDLMKEEEKVITSEPQTNEKKETVQEVQ
jgi:uncharacterized protein YxeA